MAWTAGLYLPKLGNHDDWNLRLEGGRTSNRWYAHWSYNDGYVHKGNIMGDCMGNSSNRLYARLGHWDKKSKLNRLQRGVLAFKPRTQYKCKSS
ncbi:capsule assembly Wzi family protein [Veillonella sp.]|uniref:capsule assembly Wzi family protein n=1 Tax=Veillonella sp. TaxID=1926307 RepID=UPI00338E3A00